jgi:hypothetical protein
MVPPVTSTVVVSSGELYAQVKKTTPNNTITQLEFLKGIAPSFVHKYRPYSLIDLIISCMSSIRTLSGFMIDCISRYSKLNPVILAWLMMPCL